MPTVVDGALCRTGPTKSDPTRPANVQKNLSQPDPLKLINICIQYVCKIFTICIDLATLSQSHDPIRKNCKKCDPIRPVGPSTYPWTTLIFPAMGSSDVCLIEFHSNPSRDRPFPSPNQTDDLKKPDEPQSIPAISGTHMGICI